LPFLRQPGTLRLQINVIPVQDGHGQSLRSRLPHLPLSALFPLFSTAAPAALPDDDDLSRTLKSAKSLMIKHSHFCGISNCEVQAASPLNY
jgi:hypothetical protein